MFGSEPIQDFRTLLDSLNFKSPFCQAFPLVEGHVHGVQQKLIRWINEPGMVPSDIRTALASLPAEDFARLYTSPYFCELLMALEDKPEERDRLRQQLIQGFVAEIRRVDPNFKHPLRPPWTLGGDVVLDERIRERFPALQTKCGIALNYQSYAHNTGREGIGGYSYEVALKHKERIETGKEIVAEVSPSAHSLIELFVTTIQFRQNKSKPNVINSSSHDSIGLIRCDNFHSIHGDMPEVTDMLVHESIHQYLHLFEEQLYPFVDVTKIPSEKLLARDYASPWSGNPLDIRSYTHAILVWYGLIHFWMQYLRGEYRHPEVSQALAEQKLQEASFGFLREESVLANLGSMVEVLHPIYRREVERIQAELRAVAEFRRKTAALPLGF